MLIKVQIPVERNVEHSTKSLWESVTLYGSTQ